MIKIHCPRTVFSAFCDDDDDDDDDGEGEGEGEGEECGEEGDDDYNYRFVYELDDLFIKVDRM